MQIIVKKFGGTSLADVSRINRAISFIKKSLNSGNKVVVVVSLLWEKKQIDYYRLTDNLEEYKKSDDIASLMASGEQISSSFFSILLNKNNIIGKSFQGWQVPIYTRKNFLNSYYH